MCQKEQVQKCLFVPEGWGKTPKLSGGCLDRAVRTTLGWGCCRGSVRGRPVGRGRQPSPRLASAVPPQTCAIGRGARPPPGGAAAAGRAGGRLQSAARGGRGRRPRRPAPCSMAAAGAAQPQAGAVAAAAATTSAAAEESSDSEPEQEPGSPQKLIRKVSTSGQIRQKVRAGAAGRASGSGSAAAGSASASPSAPPPPPPPARHGLRRRRRGERPPATPGRPSGSCQRPLKPPSGVC